MGARDANGTQAPVGKEGGASLRKKRRGETGREGGIARKRPRRIKPTSRRMGPAPRPFLVPAPELAAPLTAFCLNPILKPVEQFHIMHKAYLK